MRFFFGGLIVLWCFFSCSDKKKHQIDVSKIKVNYSLKRYDVDFYNTTKETLPILKNKYPYLFPSAFTDSIALAKMNDKDELELYRETQKIYSDVSGLNNELSTLFKHIKYYNKQFKSPTVITMLTNIDYDSRVIYADSLVLISLDGYLGKEHQFYNDYPIYIKENNTPDNIIVDVAYAVIENQVSTKNDRSFLGKIINEGKKMYLLDLYLPLVSDKLKIGYEDSKLDWAIVNEEQVWKYFIEKQLLFDTDKKLNKRFIDKAPFSKFYLTDDKNSAGRIGVWLGWQIVRSYMQYNDVSLQKLLEIKPEDLLKKSKYKPKK